MSAEKVPAWLSINWRTYMPPSVTIVRPPRNIVKQEQVSTKIWLGLPHFLGQASTMMETTVSSRENCVPRPSARSMMKKRIAHRWEPGRRDTASG